MMKTSLTKPRNNLKRISLLNYRNLIYFQINYILLVISFNRETDGNFQLPRIFQNQSYTNHIQKEFNKKKDSFRNKLVRIST